MSDGRVSVRRLLHHRLLLHVRVLVHRLLHHGLLLHVRVLVLRGLLVTLHHGLTVAGLLHGSVVVTLLTGAGVSLHRLVLSIECSGGLHLLRRSNVQLLVLGHSGVHSLSSLVPDDGSNDSQNDNQYSDADPQDGKPERLT